MEVIRFTLEGRFAFFKKPDVNTYLYFTYGNIHKIALLGMFGGILGYKGYNQMSFEKKYEKDFKEISKKAINDYPEFYERLNKLKIAIAPRDISINKKVQVFNNSVGYASKEQGGNLIIKEQWLENPSWDIYVAIEDEESKKLSKALVNRDFVYLPYLGKNDHLADIRDVTIIKEAEKIDNVCEIHSLFVKENFKFIEEDNCDDLEKEEVPILKYEEKLPISLEETTNKYEFGTFVFTNTKVEKIGEVIVYRVESKNIMFI